MVKGMANLSLQRAPSFQQLATADEQGLKGFNVSTWNGFFGPKGMAPEIVAKLNQVVSATIDTPVIAEKLHEQGVTPPPPDQRTPEFLAKFVKDEVARWDGPIKAAGIKASN